jgi:hypothetical protein
MSKAMPNIREEEKENSSTSSLVTESIAMESSSDSEFEMPPEKSYHKQMGSGPQSIPI